MLSFYPQQRFSYYPAGPAPAPAPSSRDRYLAALAEAKAAEEEYLRDQALQQEEAALQRRLQEIQLRKQQTSLRHPTNHATPFIPGYGRSYDFPYVQRQELEREAFQQAIAARQAQLEIAREQLAAQQLRETHQRAAQQLRQQIVSASPLQRRRSGCHCEPFQCQRACGTQLTRRPAFKRVQTPPESQSINVEVDLGQLLGFPSAHKLKTVTPPVRRASSTPAPQPVKATPAKQHSEADAIQQVLDLFLGPEKPLLIPAPASQQSKKAPAQQAKPDNSLPREVEIDLSRGFEDFLSALGLAPRPQPQASTSSKAASSSSLTTPAAAAPAEASKTAEKVNIAATTQQAPESTEHVLKRELEARLNNEYEAEVRDTIQAIFASLHDNHTPAPSAPEAAPAPSSSSSDKGKTKIVIESPSEPTSKDIADALNEVRSIETAFTALESDFTFPAQLDFDLSTTSFDDAASVHSADSEGSASSHLAFTSRNHPIRFYEQALGSLLTQLDAVESFGNEELRKARKEVVAKVEKALDELEWEVQGRWRSKLAKESKASEASSPTEPVAAQETQSTTTVGTEEQEEAKQVNVVEAQAPEVQSPESVNVTATPVESSLAPVDVDAASDPVQSTTESEVLVQTVPEPVEEEVVPAVDDVPQDVEVALASNSAVTDEEVPAERALEVEDIVSEFASAPVETDAAPSPQEIPTLDAIIPALDESAVDGPSEPESSTSSLATSVATIKPQAYEVEESSESEAEAETEDAVDDDVESISEDDVDTFLLPSSKELEAQRKPRHDDESTSDWSEVEA